MIAPARWLILFVVASLAGCGEREAPPDARPTAPATREQLLALGYVSEGGPAPARTGVTVNEPGASPGLTLIVPGHAPMATLIELDGTPVHTWSASFESIFPTHPLAAAGQSPPASWRRARVLEDGSLLVIWEGFGLARLRADSSLVWARNNSFHHDLDLLPDGTIVALSRTAEDPGDGGDAILREEILYLDPLDGTTKRRIDLDAIIEMHPVMGPHVPARGDRLHNNTVEHVGEWWGARDGLLVSLLTIDAVALLDTTREDVVWWSLGAVRKQHHPTRTSDDTLLVFDNQGRDGRSRVTRIDRNTRAVGWSWDDGGRLFTETCGALHETTTGSLIVVETERSRAIEVGEDGRAHWEYVHPARTRDGRLTMLFDVVRLRSGFPTTWMER